MQPSDFFVQPPGTPPVLVELAAEYERRCEAYDRTVCTGPADERGNVQPANARELGLISRNARQVWEELRWRASALGHSGADLKRAIAQAEA